jgi:hypothetical protein
VQERSTHDDQDGLADRDHEAQYSVSEAPVDGSSQGSMLNGPLAEKSGRAELEAWRYWPSRATEVAGPPARAPVPPKTGEPTVLAGWALPLSSAT